MIEETKYDKPIFSITLGDLKMIINEVLAEREADKEVQKFLDGGKAYVYGIDGLAELLGVSRSTAQRIKNSGKLDPAISQTGHVIVINASMALDLMRKN